MIEGLGNVKATVNPFAGQGFVRNATKFLVVAAVLAVTAGSALAQATEKTVMPAEKADATTGDVAAPADNAAAPAPTSFYDRIWSYDKIWGLAKLYSNPNNPYIQELRIVGREQVDWYHFDGEQTNADNFVDRRTRIGLKSKVFQTITLHAEVDLNLEGDEVYSKLTDSYVQWSPDKRFNFTVGKQSVKFTLDGSISSTSLITIDRSNIANNFWFPDEYVPGVRFSGDIGKWSYNAGYFTAGDQNSEFGNFDAGSFFLLSGGYDFAERLGLTKALVRVDYVWQDSNPGNDFTRPNEDVVSVNGQFEKGRWGFSSDIDYAKGYGSQHDLYGGQLTPSVTFFETWQGVLRYTGINSDGPNGIRLARYENHIVTGKGDEYNEIYLGLNKYFYGHKLKWQTGIQYANMKDSADDGGKYNGWGITTGLRVSW
jgi:phosphate-selective porin OprO/OprP